jgi:hypothetical protein
MLDIGLSLKSSWINFSPLLISCYNLFSSTHFDVGSYCDCSSTTCCYNFSFSTGLDVEIDYNCSSTIGWGLVSIFSFESKITITYSTGIAVEVLVFLKKFSVIFNSFSKSLLIYSCSKIQISFAIGACCCNPRFGLATKAKGL